MWKLQRNKKGQFTGMLVNEKGETKPQLRDKNGKFIKQETYKPIDYKFPELPALPELNWNPVPGIFAPPIISIFTIVDAFAGRNQDVSNEFSAEDIIKAYRAGLNDHRNSFILPTRQAELYLEGLIAERKSLAQRKV